MRSVERLWSVMRFELHRLGPWWLLLWVISTVATRTSVGRAMGEGVGADASLFFACTLAPVFLIGLLCVSQGPRCLQGLWKTRPLTTSELLHVQGLLVVVLVIVPMGLGHALVLWRLGLPTSTFVLAVARGLAGLVLFSAWTMAVALLSRRWPEFWIGMFLSYFLLARPVLGVLSKPSGALIAPSALLVVTWLGTLLARWAVGRAPWGWALGVTVVALVGLAPWLGPASSASPAPLVAELDADLEVDLVPIDPALRRTGPSPFVCARINDSELEPGFVYEFEVSQVTLAGHRVVDFSRDPSPAQRWQIAAGSDGLLPHAANLRLGGRLGGDVLGRLRSRQDPVLEVWGTLRQLKPGTASVLDPVAGNRVWGPGGRGPDGRIMLTEMSAYNRELRLEMVSALALDPRAGFPAGSRGSRVDRVWLGPDRSWAIRLPFQESRARVPVSYLAPLAGVELGVWRSVTRSPFDTVSRDLPGSLLVLTERQELGERQMQLLAHSASVDDFLCQELPG